MSNARDYIKDGAEIYRNSFAIIRAESNQYKKDEDLIGEFIDQRCTLDNRMKSFSGSLIREFESWAIENGYRMRLSGKALKERMLAIGCIDGMTDGKTVWKGIGISAPMSIAQRESSDNERSIFER